MEPSKVWAAEPQDIDFYAESGGRIEFEIWRGKYDLEAMKLASVIHSDPDILGGTPVFEGAYCATSRKSWDCEDRELIDQTQRPALPTFTNSAPWGGIGN